MRKLFVATSLAFLLCSCGQTDPPTVSEVKSKLEYFETTSPRGVIVECLQYGSESNSTNDSKSWFAISCWPILSRPQ